MIYCKESKRKVADCSHNNCRPNNKIKNEFTFNLLATKAQNHLIHIISISNDKDKLLFNLAGFYGGLLRVLKENELI